MKYYALLTTLGEQLIANHTALGTQLTLTHMAVGDGGGTLPTPDPHQTALIAEKRRAAINQVFVDDNNPNQIIAEQIIPEPEGGWWIREIGLFDQAGNLIAIANCPETYKPQMAEGSGRVQVIRLVLIVSHTESVTLKIDPSVILASRQYVDSIITAIDEKIKKLGNSATRNVGQIKGTVAAGDDSRILAAEKAIDDTQIGFLKQSLTLIASPDDLSDLPAGARRFAMNAPGSSVLPLGTYAHIEVIAKRASANGTAIRVTQYNNPANEWTGTRHSTSLEANFTWAKNYNTLNKPTPDDINAVPNTRTVNGKPLNTNITLTSSDLGISVPSAPNLTAYATMAWANSRFITNITLGAASSLSLSPGPNEKIIVPDDGISAGYVITGISAYIRTSSSPEPKIELRSIQSRRLMKTIDGVKMAVSG